MEYAHDHYSILATEQIWKARNWGIRQENTARADQNTELCQKPNQEMSVLWKNIPIPQPSETSLAEPYRWEIILLLMYFIFQVKNHISAKSAEKLSLQEKL